MTIKFKNKTIDRILYVLAAIAVVITLIALFGSCKKKDVTPAPVAVQQPPPQKVPIYLSFYGEVYGVPMSSTTYTISDVSSGITYENGRPVIKLLYLTDTSSSIIDTTLRYFFVGQKIMISGKCDYTNYNNPNNFSGGMFLNFYKKTLGVNSLPANANPYLTINRTYTTNTSFILTSLWYDTLTIK